THHRGAVHLIDAAQTRTHSRTHRVDPGEKRFAIAGVDGRGGHDAVDAERLKRTGDDGACGTWPSDVTESAAEIFVLAGDAARLRHSNGSISPGIEPRRCALPRSARAMAGAPKPRRS